MLSEIEIPLDLDVPIDFFQEGGARGGKTRRNLQPVPGLAAAVSGDLNTRIFEPGGEQSELIPQHRFRRVLTRSVFER